jgi:hypothetical protein
MHRAFAAAVAALVVITSLIFVVSGSASSAATDQAVQGVTPTSIKVGITYLDTSAIKNIVNIDPGNFQVAYTALIHQINAKGGINGRKIVPIFQPIDPIGTAPAATACTTLTEDDKVFAVIGFFQAADTACYLETHDTPLIGATLTKASAARSKAPWFNDVISDNDLVPKEMEAFHQEGVFARRKVAVVGDTSDQAEVGLVLSELKKLKVNVVQSATNSVPDTDQAATDSEYAVIAQKFKAAGANVVIAVGDAGVSWPEALQDNQSTYLPRLIVPDYSDLETVRRHPAARRGMERLVDASLRRHRPRRRAKSGHQQPRHSNGLHAGDVGRPRERLPGHGALRGRRQGRRQNAEQRDVQPGRRVPRPHHPSRRGWGLPLRTGPSGRRWTGLCLSVEHRLEKARTESHDRLNPCDGKDRSPPPRSVRGSRIRGDTPVALPPSARGERYAAVPHSDRGNRKGSSITALSRSKTIVEPLSGPMAGQPGLPRLMKSTQARCISSANA